jgi:hypothetical protein
MKRRLVLLAVCALSSVSLPAWDWPVEDADVSATFGQLRGETLVRGIEFRADAVDVHPAASGVVEYVGDGSGPAGGIGTFVAIRHEQGFLSIYGYLDPDVEVLPGDEVSRESVIGRVGSTGAATTRTLQFEIYDLEAGLNVNPLLLLPDLPDTRRPAVYALYAVANGTYADLSQNPTIAPGEYQLLAEVADAFRRGGNLVAPYEIALFVDGRERRRIRMERIIVTEGAARLASGTQPTRDEIYDDEGLIRLGSLVVGAGESDIELIVSDFAGNETAVSLAIQGALQTDEDVQQEPNGE